jgi:hypothetical protein
MRMLMHVVALTFVISADPEKLSGISRSVQERHIESNLNKAFYFLFYSSTCRPSFSELETWDLLLSRTHELDTK